MKYDTLLIGDVDEDLLKTFVESLIEAEKTRAKKELKVLLSSSGGDAHVAMAFYDVIKSSNLKMSVIGTGIVASAASLIFMAFKERYMTQNAYFMVHEDSISGLEGAKVSQIEKEAQHARRIEDHWTTLFPETQKLNYLDWAYLHREETYFNAEECLAYGIIKGIV